MIEDIMESKDGKILSYYDYIKRYKEWYKTHRSNEHIEKELCLYS